MGPVPRVLGEAPSLRSFRRLSRSVLCFPVFALACAALPAHAATVYAHYSFDSNYDDSSGNNRHGTLTDVGTQGNSGITTTTGQHVFGGGAMNFSSDADFIAIPSKTFSTGVPYTIAFWARRADASRDWDMVAGRRSDNNFFIALGSATSQVVGLRWRSSSTAADRQADFAVGADTAWHHYAVVASGSTITLYYDGELFATATGKQTGFIIDTIGQAYSGNTSFAFHGQLDEMWIFEGALNATEVSNLKTYNNIIPEPGVSLLGALGIFAMLRRRRRETGGIRDLPPHRGSRQSARF